MLGRGDYHNPLSARPPVTAPAPQPIALPDTTIPPWLGIAAGVGSLAILAYVMYRILEGD